MWAGLERSLVLLAVWALVALVLWWGDLPPRARRGIALGMSVAGLVFLVVALRTVGVREAYSTGSFLFGGTLGGFYVSEYREASASLPYYALTGICLFLGTAGLAMPESLARRASRHWLTLAIAASILVTVARFALEKAAAPPSWTMAAGITWLPPLVGAFFALRLKEEGRGWRDIARHLLIYAFAVRVWVVLLYMAASGLHLGSHYDLSTSTVTLRNPVSRAVHYFPPATGRQLVAVVLLPQLVVWPIFTLLAGLLGAGMATLTMGRGPRLDGVEVRPPLEMAGSGGH